jgi:hypothetical protein
MVGLAVKFISRKDLGWPASAAPRKTKKTLGIKIHYEGTNSPVRDHSYCKGYWTGIRNSHLANKAEGYSDVAYSYAVCRHGYVLEGRGLGFRTGANGNQTLNADHDAVVILYGTNDKSVSEEVVTAVREVIAFLRGHDTGKEIKGHRDGYATACPGGPLYAFVKSGEFEPVKAPPAPPKPKPKPVPVYAPYPGTGLFKIGKSDKVITAMGKALVREGYKGYKVGPGPQFTAADKKAYAWFQRKLGYSGADADGIPGATSWKKLRVSK